MEIKIAINRKLKKKLHRKYQKSERPWKYLYWTGQCSLIFTIIFFLVLCGAQISTFDKRSSWYLLHLTDPGQLAENKIPIILIIICFSILLISQTVLLIMRIQADNVRSDEHLYIMNRKLIYQFDTKANIKQPTRQTVFIDLDQIIKIRYLPKYRKLIFYGTYHSRPGYSLNDTPDNMTAHIDTTFTLYDYFSPEIMRFLKQTCPVETVPRQEEVSFTVTSK